LTAQHGVIAVTRAWYNLMLGQRLYVPGYGIGVVGDIGGGIPGKYWIDLAYSDDDYVAWHQNVTVYFLTPVPENIAWILP
jgi:3D (Asp-Asp-Asp) domain-containing protein